MAFDSGLVRRTHPVCLPYWPIQLFEWRSSVVLEVLITTMLFSPFCVSLCFSLCSAAIAEYLRLVVYSTQNMFASWFWIQEVQSCGTSAWQGPLCCIIPWQKVEKQERVELAFITTLLSPQVIYSHNNDINPFMKVKSSWPNHLLLGPTSQHHFFGDEVSNIRTLEDTFKSYHFICNLGPFSQFSPCNNKISWSEPLGVLIYLVTSVQTPSISYSHPV